MNLLENLLTSGAARALGGEYLRIFDGAFGFQDGGLPLTRHGTAVQVCENNRRIKGVRLWGRRLDAAGLPTGETMLREFERTNCGAKDRAEKVACAEDRVAAGVRVNYYGNLPGSKTTFSGLPLLCRLK